MPLNKTVYARISEELKRRISAGEFSGGRLPSERALAGHYKINRLTLRKALGQLFEEGLIAKLGPKGTFVSDEDSLGRSVKNRRVALIMTGGNTHNSYFGTIISSIKKSLGSHGAGVVVYLIDNAADMDDLRRISRMKRDFNGMIVMGYTTPAMLRGIKSFRIPSVLLGLLSNADEIERRIDQVAEDCHHYTYSAVSLLLDKGFRRIAFADAPAYQWSMISQSAYMKALEDHGLPYSEELVFRSRDDSASGAVELAGRILSVSPDALFIRNDLVAKGLIEGLAKEGVEIPGDLAVITAGHPNDSVSHLDLPKFESDPGLLGRKAAELLVRRMALPTAEPRRELVKSTLVRGAKLRDNHRLNVASVGQR